MKATRLDAESWAKGVVGVFGGIGESRCIDLFTEDRGQGTWKGLGNGPPTLYSLYSTVDGR